jgi:hypothetical protein
MATFSLAFGALIAFPVFAQFQSTVAGKSSAATIPMPGEPRFELHADLSAAESKIVAGYSEIAKTGVPPALIGHRYFYDETAHSYFGYDVVIQPEPPIDWYRVTFHDLSIGPLDFQAASQDSLEPSRWRKLPPPTLPAPKIVKAGDTISVGVSQGFTDAMIIAPMPGSISYYTSNGPLAFQQLQSMMRQGTAASTREAPTVFGDARVFSVDDVEMRIQPSRVTVNGKIQEYGDPSRIASGSLIWIYIPDHGRYIFSLAARPGLGFVKAGEIRGGIVGFTAGKDKVVLESPTMIVPGNAPFILYVLHDSAWEPTAQGQKASILIGSVSPRELTSTQGK